MITKKLFVMGSMAVMGLAFMSCSKDLSYDAEAANQAAIQNQDALYTSNFIKRYGPIDPNQSWDFATSTPTLSAASSGSSTRAVASVSDANFSRTTKDVTVQKEISEWVFENLPKGIDNSGKGRPFVMQVGSKNFGIVPLFQGCASYYWELWMHVDDMGNSGDMLIWSKGEDLEYRKAGTTDSFKKLGTGKNGMEKDKGPYEVKAKSYIYDKLPEGSSMSFYLKVWKSPADFQKYEANPYSMSYQPEITSSLSSMMLDVNCPYVPTGVPEGYTATIIGCEDDKNGDNDYEDLIFMVYGDPVPPTKRVEKVVEEKTKRYILEDLGENDDFDFNDVVFDVSYDRWEITYTYASGDDVHPSSIAKNKLDNIGIVRAAGGIYDFDIKVGNDVKWTKSSVATGITNTYAPYNPNYVMGQFEAKNYNADKNNVSVVVRIKNTTTATDQIYEIPFPELGAAPKIVAVPANTYWMNERVQVPVEWFKAGVSE